MSRNFCTLLFFSSLIEFSKLYLSLFTCFALILTETAHILDIKDLYQFNKLNKAKKEIKCKLKKNRNTIRTDG